MFPTFVKRSDGSFPTNKIKDFNTAFDFIGQALDDQFHSLGYSPIKGYASAFVPAAEVIETNKHYKVVVEAPGVEKSDLTVSLDDQNSLIIRGEKKDGYDKSQEDRSVGERFYGSFRREFSLPKRADINSIKVKFENGVLEATIPKVEESPQTKQIEIT